MTADASLINYTATELVELLQRGEVSPLDLLDSLEERIAMVEPTINALPTLCFDRAREHAKRVMALPLTERGLSLIHI